jgi:beta-phosphoglucomutase
MSVKSVKAIIFDMDGVLVDTEPHHLILEKKLFKRLGLEINGQEHGNYLGLSTKQMWLEITKNHDMPQTPEELTAKNREEILNYFSKLDKVELMPGIRDLLERLSQKGIPLALASASEAAVVELILSRTVLKKYFTHIVSLEAVGKSKPEPDIYLHTAKLLDVLPEECLVIEDSHNGIKAAKSARMICIAYSKEQNLADESTDDFYRMPEILRRYIDF